MIIKVNPKNDEKWVATCVSSVLHYNQPNEQLHNIPPYKRDGKWQLDNNNNWFLHKISDEEYELNYRESLSASDAVKKMLLGLTDYLEWRLR